MSYAAAMTTSGLRAVAVAALLALACRAGAVTIKEYPVPAGLPDDPLPGSITVGRDGNLWFTLFGDPGDVGYFAPATPTAMTTVPVLHGAPTEITTGPDGNIWFTAYSELGEISLASPNSVTETWLPSDGPWFLALPQGITAGPDGNLWFCDNNSVRRFAPATPGSVTTIPVSVEHHSPVGITTGPDGNLWFTGDQIGRITPGSNQVTWFPIPSTPPGDTAEPWGITKGPDGNLWFTEHGTNRIGRIMPGSPNTITEFAIPTASSGPMDITVGCDGHLWFTELDAGQIGRIDPQSPNTIEEFPVPTAHSGPWGIVAGPDGGIWFTEYWGKRIGRVPVPCPRGASRTHLIDWNWRWRNSPVAVAAVGNLLYVPAKAGFAGLGIIASGMAYGLTLGSAEAASTIWRDTTGGDYFITPGMVRLENSPRFVGPDRPVAVHSSLPPEFVRPPRRWAQPPPSARVHRAAGSTHRAPQ